MSNAAQDWRPAGWMSTTHYINPYVIHTDQKRKKKNRITFPQVIVKWFRVHHQWFWGCERWFCFPCSCSTNSSFSSACHGGLKSICWSAWCSAVVRTCCFWCSATANVTDHMLCLFFCCLIFNKKSKWSIYAQKRSSINVTSYTSKIAVIKK